MTNKVQHPNGARSAIDGYTAIAAGVFISRSHELAQMFTVPAWHNPVKAGKYLEDGMKPIEAFCNDIKQNLICWAINSHADAIFYRTPNYWYMFQLADASNIYPSATNKIVWMTRYRNSTWERLDDWANPHSVAYIGRKFLLDYPDKRVPLFNTGGPT